MIRSAHSSASSIQEESASISLLQLKYDERARITKLDSEELAISLLKMGIREGDELIFRGTAPLRDPLIILVNRTKVSLRKKDAAHIWVNKL